MMAEWRLNGDGKGGFQSHLNQHSVTIQSTEWQADFSDLSVCLFKKNEARRGSNLGRKNERESKLTIRPRRPLFALMTT